MTNEDIDVAIKIREAVIQAGLDKAAVKALLEWMLEWNKNRPAPST